MAPDQTCLHQYTSQAGQAATGATAAGGGRHALDELVRRHLNLVYSSALRQVRDPHLAEDVTQAVFLILAQKAGTIRDGVAVAGWLLAVTRRTAVHAMKRRSLDRRHEVALAKPERDPDGGGAGGAEAPWDQIAPLLDDALTRLPQPDRDALVLRILENQSLAQVGAELGISQDAAKMRIARALTRLRKFLQRHNISTPAAALSATLATRALHAAPPHLLAATLTTTATGTASPAVAALVKASLRAMAQITAKIVAATAMAFLILTTLSTVAFSYAFGPSPATPAAAPIPLPNTARVIAPESALPSIFSTDDWFTGSNFDAAHPGSAADPNVFPGLAADRFLVIRSGTTAPSKLAVDARGNVFAVGQTWDALGIPHAIIREKPLGKAWQPIFDSDALSGFGGIAVAPNGDLYIDGYGRSAGWLVFRRAAGQTEFVPQPIDHPPTEGPSGIGEITVDEAGNVYVVGLMSNHWLVLKQSHGATPFAIVDDFVADAAVPDGKNMASGITVVKGQGPSTGIYVTGHCDVRLAEVPAQTRTHWMVRRSRDEGATWQTVDDCWQGKLRGAYRAQIPGPVVSGAHGAVYVAGVWDGLAQAAWTGNISGNDRSNHWQIRSSDTGEPGTWVVDNDFVLSAELPYSAPNAMTADDAGNIYVAGHAASGDGITHAVIRTNAGGDWHTLDDFSPVQNRACWTALAFDRGILYAAGWVQGQNPGWIVRSVRLALGETPHSESTTTAFLKH